MSTVSEGTPMSTVSATNLLGRRVVVSDDASEAGEVKAFVFERDLSHVRRVQVAGRRRSAELVDWQRIDAIGDDAVMVDHAENIHETVNDADKAFLSGDITVFGARVLDTSGRVRGQLHDVELDPATGEVVAIMTDEGRVLGERIRSVGTFAVVVDS